MKIALYIISGLLGLLIIFIIYRLWATKKASQKRDEELLKEVQPILNALDVKVPPDQKLIQQLAEDSAARKILYSILKHFGKIELFPAQYRNFKSGAESSLVYWLLHPNELGSRPDEIQFIQTISKEHVHEQQTRTLAYYVFKFKMNDPHWAAKDGWTVGIAGPYFTESDPYESSAFSTFEKFESKSPEEHVNWVNTMMKKKGLY